MPLALSAIQNNYKEHFPIQVPLKAAQGFAFAATAQLVAGSDLNMALLGGALTATATIIEAVSRPIIITIFPNNECATECIQTTAPRLITMGLANSVAPWIGMTYKMTPIALSLAGHFTLNNNWFQNNVGMVGFL